MIRQLVFIVMVMNSGGSEEVINQSGHIQVFFEEALHLMGTQAPTHTVLGITYKMSNTGRNS